MLRLIPWKVRKLILSESDCGNFFLCSLINKGAPEIISVDALRPSSESHGLAQSDERSVETVSSSNQVCGRSKISTWTENLFDEDWKLVYDVIRINKNGFLFIEDHMLRMKGSIEKVSLLSLPPDAIDYIKSCLEKYAMTRNRNYDDPNRIQVVNLQEDRNVKFVMWLRPEVCYADSSGSPTDELNKWMFIVYFVKSFFPPPHWYLKGTQFALLFNASRQNPHVKVMHPELNSRVKDLRKTTGAFEVMLVHDKERGFLVPECSRSNYLLITESGRILCSSQDDILIGVTLLATNRAARRAGLGAIEHLKLNLKDICSSRCLLMLGTSPGILPVRELILYYDQESEANFRAAASFLNMDVSCMSNLRVITSDPPKAVLEFVVQDDLVDRLMKVYQEEGHL